MDDVEEDEMPSLANSYTSSVGYDQYPFEHDDHSYYSADHHDNEEDESIERPHTKSVQRTIKSGLAFHSITSAPRPRSRSRLRLRSTALVPPPCLRCRHRHFSCSRRASLDRGSTTNRYPAPHMAALDACLRSTCGLRLRTDGMCDFLFERQRFTIESSAGDGGTGDFLLSASLGPLEELERRNRPRNLMRVLARLNEGLKCHDGRGEDSGLLRIDVRRDGPHVAFIYYGHEEEIEDPSRFLETLDNFVDDALEFSDELRGIKEQDRAEEEAAPD